jgi:hypothetical protein
MKANNGCMHTIHHLLLTEASIEFVNLAVVLLYYLASGIEQYYYTAANPNPVGKKLLLDKPNDASSYSRVHARYHPIFRDIVEKYGYYDMFLIDPEGTVVYTVFKETDFTTNFTNSPYKESNLAEAIAAARQAKGKGYVKIVDFKPYSPSYNAPFGED